jgi:hypothetical protein
VADAEVADADVADAEAPITPSSASD